MTDSPGQWGPQGGYSPPGPGGYPPQPPPGYPPQGPGGYPPQPPPGYPQQPGAGGFPPPGSYAPQPPPGGYPPQQPAGFGPQGPGPGGPGIPSGTPGKKSPVMIIAIVAAAIVLLAAIGGIIMVLNRGGATEPEVTITPSQPAPPTEQPTPQPSGSASQQPQPTPSQTTQPPTGGAIDVGNGIQLVPASGWGVKKTGKNAAQLSDGKSLFLGQSLQVSQDTNAGQLCDAWHREISKGTSNGKFQDPKDVDLGTNQLKAASCVAQVTVSGGQGTTKLILFSLVSVRQSDGVTIIGTAYFTPNTDTTQLNKDFSAMVNSMLKSQVAGG